MKKILSLALVLLLLSACLPGITDDADTPITIAVLAPLQGDYEMLGAATRNGVVLAVEAWNREGGVLGQTIQVVLADSECDYKTAREAATHVIEEQGARFIIGPVCANAAEGVAQIAVEAGVLHINHAAVNLDLTLDIDEVVRPLVFRVPIADPVQGQAAAIFATENLVATTAAIITPEDSVYASNLAEAFEQTFKDRGGTIVARETYILGAESFYEALDPVREEYPDVVYMPGYASVINRITQQARSYGMAQPFLGSDGWDSEDLTATGENYFTTHYSPLEPRATVRTWVAEYEARYIVAPDVVATLAYDAANILLEAIAAANSRDPEVVAERLERLAFDAVTGALVFDNAHNAVKDVLMLKVQDGVVAYEGRVSLVEEE